MEQVSEDLHHRFENHVCGAEGSENAGMVMFRTCHIKYN